MPTFMVHYPVAIKLKTNSIVLDWKVKINGDDFVLIITKRNVTLTSLERNSAWSCKQIITGDPFL